MRIRRFFKAIAIASTVLMVAMPSIAADAVSSPAVAATNQERVVYHVSDVANAREALANVSNHLVASPSAQITVLANAKGILLLIAKEKDKLGEYSEAVSALQSKGVRFLACRNSLNKVKLDPSDVLAGVGIVPAGVAELVRLQLVEHYAYIKP